MRKSVLIMFALTLLPAYLFAVDGQVLINQSTVMAAGGFPYTITQAGSYKLSGNLTVDQNTTAIVVAHDNVSIDLNGFTIGGPNMCVLGQFNVSCTYTTGGNGIDAGFSMGLTVTNGTISGMGQFGINVAGGFGGNRIDSVLLTNNGSHGIKMSANALIDRCRILLNGGYGVYANGAGGSVQRSLVSFNLSNGLGLSGGWTYSQNNLSSNGLSFIYSVTGGVNQGQNMCSGGPCPGAVF